MVKKVDKHDEQKAGKWNHTNKLECPEKEGNHWYNEQQALKQAFKENNNNNKQLMRDKSWEEKTQTVCENENNL